MVAKSRSAITNTLRLLTLSVYTQQMLGSNKITAGHAKILIGLDENLQKKIVDSIIGQVLSVRETEQLVRNFKSDNKKNTTNNITKINTKINFNPLESVIQSLNKENISVKTGKNYFKIKLITNEDIESLLKFFIKS